MNTSKPTVIDLFSGVGGLSLGAARAGFRLALAVELDEHAMAAHKINFPNSNHLESDISNLEGAALLSSAGLQRGELDGLVGGPPCQGFSAIGRRSATDARNNLFVKFFELVEQCQPNFFVAENVLGILDEQYQEIRDQAIRHVQDDYVLLYPLKLVASDFGAPTNRERVFFMGYRQDIFRPFSRADFLAKKVDELITVADALRGLPSIEDNWITEEESWREIQELPRSAFWDRVVGHIPEGVGDITAIELLNTQHLVSGCFGTRHSDNVRERYRRLLPGGRDRVSKSVRLKLDGLCPTIRAGTNKDHGSYQAVRPIHPVSPRVITPREAARLQGFPDWFRFAPTKWHSFRQIGNSVSPILAEILFGVIRSHLLIPSV